MREMKDSCAPWCDRIPSNWQTLRLKYVMNNYDSQRMPVDAGKRSQEGDVLYDYYGASGVIDSIDGYTHTGRRLLIGEDGANLVLRNLPLIYIADGKYWVNNHAHILAPKYGWSLDFFAHQMEVIDYFEYITGSAQPKLSQGNLNRVYLAVPPADEQECIANLLDYKCAEIDALSADIQSEIDTLEAYKRSVITEAVTKGLDKTVPMKDSGIEWVGKIPDTWDIKKGKYCLRYVQKPTKPDDDVITCFRDGEVTLRKNRREEGFTISLKEIGYQGIDVGDLIVHGMDGFAGAIGISDSRGKASPVLNVLDTDNNKRYIMYYLRSLAFNGVFLALSTGIRVRTCDTNWGKLRELLYVLPPKKEQDDIVRFIDERLNATDEIIAQKQEQLAVLADYKKSVIYEYVTGKKEVPVA